MFVWSDRTITKLKESKVNGTLQFKQLKLGCGTLELMYSLMMANVNVIQEGVPFQQFVGPIKLN